MAFTFCLGTDSRSARGDTLRLSLVFLELVSSPTHVHGGLDSQNMSEFFDDSMYTHSPHFPVRFLINFSFTLTISLPQVATILNSF